MRKGVRTALLLTWMVVIVLSSVLLPFVTGTAGKVRADGTITLSLQTTSSNPNPGDIITVTVYADNLPHITRFGPIAFDYNEAQAEFVSCQPSPDLVNFIYTSDTSEPGTVMISAADEMSEELISDALEAGGNLDNDPSFYSDGQVILFSVSFRVLESADGVMTFSISDTGAFTDSSSDNVYAVSAGALFVTISEAISGDSSLSGLSIPGIALNPVFDSAVTDYTATVNRNVTEVNVDTTPTNTNASIVIGGSTNLQVGENLITIDVTSQDGSSTTQYKIYLYRQEDTLPEGAGVVDALGKTFSFVNIPPDPVMPEGFSQTVRVVNGYSVPVYAREGVVSMILYLYDGENSPGFYFYNPVNNSITPYTPGEAIVRMSKVLTVCAVPSDVSVPDGLRSASKMIGNAEVLGYTDDDGNFICYLRDEDGNRDFYVYDEDSGDFFVYRPSDPTAERIYRIMFFVFLTVSVIEAILIVIVLFIIRKIIIIRTKPRPKRV